MSKEVTKAIAAKEMMLLDVLNKLLSIKPLDYDALNVKVKYEGEDLDKLRALEQEYPELGLCNCDEPGDGISLLSLLATVTDILVGKRLAWVTEDGTPRLMTKVMWPKYQADPRG